MLCIQTKGVSTTKTQTNTVFFHTSWGAEPKGMHRNELCVPFFWRAMLDIISVNWRIEAVRLGTFGGFDLKLLRLWNMLFSSYDFHLPKKQLLQVMRWLTPTVTFRETSSEKSAICHAYNRSVTAPELFPPTLPAQVWQWCLQPRKEPEGWLKIRVTFFFWHVKIFHFFFSPRLFLIHTSMKNGLNGPFFFFFFQLASLLRFFFELWYIIKLST